MYRDLFGVFTPCLLRVRGNFRMLILLHLSEELSESSLQAVGTHEALGRAVLLKFNNTFAS